MDEHDRDRSPEVAVAGMLERDGDRIYRLGLRLCGNVHDAEDLVQETFLAAFRTWSQFEGRAKASTWLYTIATRLCGRLRRRRAGQPRTLESLSASEAFVKASDLRAEGEGPLETSLRAEVTGAVEQAIAALPDSYRLPLLLKDILDLPIADIAAVLDLPAGTVKTRLHRARLRLRDALGGELPGRAPTAEVDRQRCLDLLQMKQEALDRGVDLESVAEHICTRCRRLFVELDLERDVCHDLDRGTMPATLRRLVSDRLRVAS